MSALLPAMFSLAVANGAAGPISYLALGDSYTIGESVDPAGRWPVQLAEALASHRIQVDPPRIIARTGWTTNELSGAMDRAELDACYELVSLLIGVNNQYRGRSVEDFRPDYAMLLDRAIALAGGRRNRVFVLSIPDWGATPFAAGRDRGAIAREIDRYNAAKREITQARGVAFFDITPSTREVPDNPELVADDGLHPSAALYTRWVEQITPQVAKLIESGAGECHD